MVWGSTVYGKSIQRKVLPSTKVLPLRCSKGTLMPWSWPFYQPASGPAGQTEARHGEAARDAGPSCLPAD